MPITPPRLDDRNFEDLVEELLARIPAHTPEWVPQPGDPGRTLLELFAWLGETILYRANLVPERQRLAFLKLLGEQMQPARAATGLVSIRLDDPEATDAIQLATLAQISGAVKFETRSELTVLPVSAECYYKRPLSNTEKGQSEILNVLDGLREFHEIEGELSGYVTSAVFGEGLGDSRGIDLIQDTTDNSLWMALLAPAPGLVPAIKNTLAGVDRGRAATLNIGIAPAIELPSSFDDNSRPGRIPHVWEISTNALNNDTPVYSQLTRIADSSDEFTKRGIERYVLPGDTDDFGVLEGDVRIDANAGVGDRPPRLDDPEKLARVVAWLRLRPVRAITSMPISWAGINAVEIDQRQTISGRVIGQSNGSADQIMQLQARSVEKSSFKLQVEESGLGYRDWLAVDNLALMGRNDSVFRLDSEAGTVSFGNGINGRIPETGRRVRVESMRVGGGRAGNLAQSSLTRINAKDLNGNPVNRKLSVIQGLATEGGEDAEDLASAEKRIPARLRHRNRCVTEQDYKSLVAETPAVRVGRIEVLPKFMPQQRRSGVPGVVSVMVLPYKSLTEAPNPRPDQPFIEKVFAYLDNRRPLATELYVIGCEYVPLGLSVGITVHDGQAYDQVVNNVREALKQYLWSLPPDGPNAQGWPLGRSVQDRELEVVGARVEGVNTVVGINLFQQQNSQWIPITRAQPCDAIELPLQAWQLPELLAVVVSTDGQVSNDLTALPDPVAGSVAGGGIAVPIVPEVC
ncbi:MAG: putative baseplate assembly protein [bacterium]|nr:putative baseplate assembly protein [bacterium]